MSGFMQGLDRWVILDTEIFVKACVECYRFLSRVRQVAVELRYKVCAWLPYLMQD